jgi:excisionase family DNA binding protein
MIDYNPVKRLCTGLTARLWAGWLRWTRAPRMATRQVAELLAVSPATVLRRWRAGDIPGYRLGSNVLRFSADEVVAWLEAEVLVDLEGNIEG